jgi:excisionase family DNA binding protein
MTVTSFNIPRLMTIKRVADILSCHPETIRRAIRRGDLASYQIGGCIRLSIAQVEEYLERAQRLAMEATRDSASAQHQGKTSLNNQQEWLGDFRRMQRIRRSLE